MRDNMGKFFMMIGAALVLAAFSLFLWNQYASSRAGKASEEILTQLTDSLEEDPQEEEEHPYEESLPVEYIDGYGYIGYLSIPSLDLYLPVMDQWDYDRLKLSPCRYAGSVEMDDLVIAGHNYSSHFRPIKKLRPGDAVRFTDMRGTTYDYTVEEVDILNPSAVEEMTAGIYDLTLFTCTYGGKSRVAVRCTLER